MRDLPPNVPYLILHMLSDAWSHELVCHLIFGVEVYCCWVIAAVFFLLSGEVEDKSTLGCHDSNVV
jgi:hypothetical protein